jgi:hypothetical protein
LGYNTYTKTDTEAEVELGLAMILHRDQFGWVGPSRRKNPTDIAHGFIETNKPHDRVQCRKTVGKKGNVPNSVASTHYGNFATKTEGNTE